MKKILLATLLLISFVSSVCLAQGYTNRGRSYNPKLAEQNYLVLDKGGRTKRFRFFVGDWITFRLKGDTYKYKAEITGIYPDGIEVLQAVISLNEIDVIWLGKDNYWAYFTAPAAASGKALGGALAVGGLIAYPFDKDTSKDLLGAGAGAFAVGSFFSIFQRRKYKLGKKRRLRVIGQTPKNSEL